MKRTIKILPFLVLLSLSAFAQEAAFDTTRELTLEEEQASENYIHQGIATKKQQELCSGEGKFKDICTEERFAFSGGAFRTIEAMLPVVTRAYTMIMAVSGGTLKGPVTDANGNQIYDVQTTAPDGTVTNAQQAVPEGQTPPEGAEPATKEKTDFCRFIPVAGEALNIAMAVSDNNVTQRNLENSKPEARQAASFYALAQNHKDQAKASKMQMGVWGATAGCYTALLATSYISGDASVYLKIGGSTLITLFYMKKAKAHKERAKLLENMAKELPQAGDCNPFTATTCFCNEDSSFATDPNNFNKFCVPKPLVARNQNNDASFCVDSQQKVDENCDCAAQGTCIDRVLRGGGLDFGINPIALKNPLAGLAPLSSGRGIGNLDAITGRNLAAAQKALKEFKPSSNIDLNDSQKKLASSFNKSGLPKGVSALLAKRSSGLKLGALPSGFTGTPAAIITEPTVSSGTNIAKTAGYESGQSAGVARKSSLNNNPFARFKKKGSSNNGSGIEIEDYATKAQLEAEIIKNTDVSIFKVISNRYQVSAWREFGAAFEAPEEKNEEKK